MNSYTELYESDFANKCRKLDSNSAPRQNIPKNNRSKSRSPIRKSTKDINTPQESNKHFMVDEEQNLTRNSDVYGPALPPGLCSIVAEPSPVTQGSILFPAPVDTVSNSDVYGPALPPCKSYSNSNDNAKVKVYGPARPSNTIVNTTKEISCEDNDKKEKHYKGKL